MSKKLAIYFSDPEPMGYPFNTKYPYWEIYQDMIKDIEMQGIEVYIVRGHSYLGAGAFSHGWRIRNGAMVAVGEPIRVNLIFNRDDKNAIPEIYDCPIINHPDLDHICVDKVKTAELFLDISPKTKAVNSYDEYLTTIKEWGVKKEDKIVLKKNFLSGGQSIYIRPVTEILASLYESWDNILVQEFIDSSVGIPGITDGLHDIRVITINSEPVYTFVRIPQNRSFLANIAQGGKEVPLSLSLLPPSLLELVKKINQQLASYRPSLFASDFLNSKDGFKLVELNSRPMVCLPSLSSQTKNYIDKIVQMLICELSQVK